jgi:hypothetical protein
MLICFLSSSVNKIQLVCLPAFHNSKK